MKFTKYYVENDYFIPDLIGRFDLWIEIGKYKNKKKQKIHIVNISDIYRNNRLLKISEISKDKTIQKFDNERYSLFVNEQKISEDGVYSLNVIIDGENLHGKYVLTGLAEKVLETK